MFKILGLDIIRFLKGIIYMKKIALVGSTGSIGRQVISVVMRHPDRFKITALIADTSSDALLGQINALSPEYAVLCNPSQGDIRGAIKTSTAFFTGADSALKVLEDCGADVIFVACGGFAGLKYSLKALKLNIPLALANKETLVCGGDLVASFNGEIMPVDSEHSAIWQCLNFDRKAQFERLVITASGGAFRGRKWDTLSAVTPEEALRHPTWKMGAKITVDSATLLNKGYEVIEAHHLYGCGYDRIETVIHPQSIVHSMVKFADGACLAQTGYPTMELPIQLALTYPERLDCGLNQLDFTRPLSLEFLPLERKEYPLYDLALACGEQGGILPTVLNACSEVSVGAFLKGEIPLTDVYTVASEVVSGTANCRVESFEQLSEVDRLARARALKIIKEGRGG